MTSGVAGLSVVREGQAVEERGCWGREQRERLEKEIESNVESRPSGFFL